MDGPAPAIANAIAHALAADPRTLPMTPESLMALMEPAGA
jgi:CO/xanthine dehydrogenase Mo-binding subunit